MYITLAIVHLVVNCPVCGQFVVNRNVSDHIDSGCKSLLAKPKSKQSNSKNAWNSILGNGSSKPESRLKGKKQQKSVIDPWLWTFQFILSDDVRLDQTETNRMAQLNEYQNHLIMF